MVGGGRRAREGRAAAALIRPSRAAGDSSRMASATSLALADFQRVMGDTYWLFGGRYVGIADCRSLVPLDQHDIPLLGADGTLHLVELKGPHIPSLVRKHRNHWIVGTDVHEAASQAMNYLRTLDNTGAALTTIHANEFRVSYDMRRTFATVVIGHPAHATLLDAAERALEFEDTTRAGPAGLA
jgi:hypothetical protein